MAFGIRGLLQGGRGGEAGEVARHTVGNALVLHGTGKISSEAQNLALAVVADEEHDIVVLDLGAELPTSSWEAVAVALPRRRRGIRLMACGQHRGMAALVGQWLSERLNRTVIAPDGVLVRGAAGALFVDSATGSGWIRFRRGKPPVLVGKRYPAPPWDAAVTELQASSATGEVEPLPGGAWIRPTGDLATIARYRNRLVADIPCTDDTMTVLIGCPNTPALHLDNVIRFWRNLDPETRDRVRFVQYGDVRLRAGQTFGQTLADTLETTIVCYSGVPVGSPRHYEIKAVRAEGVLGWRPYALELGFTPRRPGDDARRPTVLRHRPPIEDTEEVDPRVYWYALDAVVEVVPAGLWVRPPKLPAGAGKIRGAVLDPERVALFFDDTVASRTQRMQGLAIDLAARLDIGARDFGVVLAASAATEFGRDEPEEATVVVPRPGPEAENGPTVAMSRRTGGELDENATVKMRIIRGENAAQLRLVAADPPSLPAATVASALRSATGEQPLVPIPAVHPAGPALPDLPAPPEPTSPAALTNLPGPIQRSWLLDPVDPDDVPLPVPSAEPLVVDEPIGPLVVDEPAGSSVVAETARLSVVAEPAGALVVDEPAGRIAGFRLQPEPDELASALIARDQQLGDERAWLRQALSRNFDELAGPVSRILSEHPGASGDHSVSADDALADSVAVRLFLRECGPFVNSGLRAGRTGPHVPFGRCVLAGLSRLPSYRGATIYRTTPAAEEWELYRGRLAIKDWGFVSALAAPCAAQDGDTDVVIWSLTGRQTALLEPEDDHRVADRVVFAPGTSFKMLEMRRPTPDQRGAILVRELATNEVSESGVLTSNRVSFDELALTSLRRSLDKWANVEPRRRIGPAAMDRFQPLPGLTGSGVLAEITQH